MRAAVEPTTRTKMSLKKVTYFGIPAKGEPIRLLLAYGGEDFINNKMALEEWPEFKKTLTFGQLPVYEEDGRMINQANSIIRYLGRKYKLNGNNEWEDLEIDAMNENFIDFQTKILNCHFEKSQSRKSKLKETLCNETIPYYLEKFDKIAKNNEGHLALKKLTWVDFAFAGFIDYLSWIVDMDLLENYPNLKAVKDNVFELPAIKAWYAMNPVDKDVAMKVIKMTGTCTEN